MLHCRRVHDGSDSWLIVSTDKESANCRLEAQYGHQQNVQIIPLMMQMGYKPTGWVSDSPPFPVHVPQLIQRTLLALIHCLPALRILHAENT